MSDVLAENQVKQYVRELKDKDAVEAIFLVQEKIALTDKNGRSYLSLSLSDVSGAIDAKVWEKAEAVGQLFQQGDFVFVKGHVHLYQNRRQLVVHDLKRVPVDKINRADFVADALRSPAEMYDELCLIIDSLDDPHIRELIRSVFSDESIRERALVCPAAKTIHHANIGGLLEHILSICGIMEFLAKHYPVLNRNYLIFGAIFHDIGKIWELEISSGIQYTDAGRLVGHMAIACQIIDEKAGRILGFPMALKDELKHIVLSHHGKLEYGSPKRPKFLEAMVVAMVDELDSKINTMVGALKSELDQGEGWTRYNQQFDRYLYLEVFRKQLNRLRS
ncbi:MAG: HD domain-containing protein [Bdellovibrionales bacterium]|nr:HD domain-containing protein [Bdellovibrionales bacterium]